MLQMSLVVAVLIISQKLTCAIHHWVPQATEYLRVETSTHSVKIRIPASSNHSCDILYVKKLSADPGYSNKCFQNNECRYVYSNQMTRECLSFDPYNIQNGAYVQIPNIETLVNGTYRTYFAQWGTWYDPVVSGETFNISNGRIEIKRDPHVTNIDGEDFFIFQTGNHTLVRLPRAATQDNSMLNVVAFVTNPNSKNMLFRRPCQNTWVTKLWVTGMWLKDIEFSTVPGEFNSPGTIRMKVGNNSANTPEDCADYLPDTMVEIISPEITPEKPKHLHHKSITKTVNLRVGQVLITVDWAQSLTKEGATNHLDFEVKHLGFAMLEIGGILGRDSHAFAFSKPKECSNNKVRSLLDFDEESSMPFASSIRATLK